MTIIKYDEIETKEVRQLAPAPAADMPVVVAQSGVRRAGGSFLKSLTKITAVIGIVSVVVSGIRHGEWTPAGMMAAAEIDFSNAWNAGSRVETAKTTRAQADAKADAELRQQFLGVLAGVAGLGIVGCMIGQAAGDHSDLTRGACEIGAAGAATFGASH